MVCTDKIGLICARFLSDAAKSATPDPGKDIFEVEAEAECEKVVCGACDAIPNTGIILYVKVAFFGFFLKAFVMIGVSARSVLDVIL